MLASAEATRHNVEVFSAHVFEDLGISWLAGDFLDLSIREDHFVDELAHKLLQGVVRLLEVG